MSIKPTWRYRLCSRLVSPLIFLHLLLRSARDGRWRYFKQRLGFIQRDTDARIHVHAASVGEVITVLPLIEHLQRRTNPPAFLVTTNTPTGASILENRLSGNAKHAYLPIDFAGATKRFFSRVHITNVWLVETEIWPWLISHAKQSNIPITIINARLSKKSQGKLAQFFKDTYRRALYDVTVLARSDEDALRYKNLSNNQNLVQPVGNLKFAESTQLPYPPALLQQAYLLAASTHENEELSLAEAWLKSSEAALLVIAPRHAERGPKLLKQLIQLQKELSPELPAPACRSAGQRPSATCKLYLADTLGEMHSWYAHAQATFVGGSLIERGGHNVLEPARYATPIIVGQHTFNFSEEVALLKSVNGIAVAPSPEQVTHFLRRAISAPEEQQQMGLNAEAVVRRNSGVIDRYTELLTHL